VHVVLRASALLLSIVLRDLPCGVLQGFGDVQLVARIVEVAVERLTRMHRMPLPALVRYSAGPMACGNHVHCQLISWLPSCVRDGGCDGPTAG
jgi:hypothetical protein